MHCLAHVRPKEYKYFTQSFLYLYQESEFFWKILIFCSKFCDRRIWVDEQLENKCCKQTFPKLLSLLWSNLQKLFRFSVYILFAKRLKKLEGYGTVLLEEIFLELEKTAFFAVFFRPNDDNCPKDLVGGSISRPLTFGWLLDCGFIKIEAATFECSR